MGEDKSDNEMMLDHCALECMNAIEMKDKEAFRSAFQVLIADVLDKMSEEFELSKE